MSSDSDSEPPSPKHMRLTQLYDITSGSNDSASSVATSFGRCSPDSADDVDVYVLSDSEFDEPYQSGRSSSETYFDYDRPSGSSSFEQDHDQSAPNQSSEAESNARKVEAASLNADVQPVYSNGSQTETCPICFLAFIDQEVATPSICNHNYCFTCLMEWSKTMNTCPVDRQVFISVSVRPKFGSNSTRHVPVETRVPTGGDPDYGVYEREVDSEDDWMNFDTGETLSEVEEEDWELRRDIVEAMPIEVNSRDSSEDDDDDHSISVMDMSFSDTYEPDDDFSLIYDTSSEEELISIT